MKTALSLSVVLFLACGAVGVRAQSALDGFDPRANDYIGVVLVQPDGKILIGGGFTTLAPNGGPTVTRNHIARLNADGTVDGTFNPNVNGRVFSIALQLDGKILVVGDFTTVGGQPRHSIARLDSATGLVDSFNPNGGANTFVHEVTVQADGKILVGGGFNTIGGQVRNNIARLDPSTGLADSFNPNPDNYVYSIVFQADGKILVGGQFTTLAPNGGAAVPRHLIARLNPDGTLDNGFDPNPDAIGEVFCVAVQAGGKILVGGGFTSIGGQPRTNIARLDPVTGLADSFNPNADPNGFVRRIAVLRDGRILAGGDFTSIGGQNRKALARLDPATGLSDSFNANLNYSVNIVVSVYGMAVQADGKILAGGTFNLAGGQSRQQIARLETDGRVDRALKVSIGGGDVLTTAVQADGKTLIGGSFTSVLSTARNHIARLNTDNSLDPTFNPNANGDVDSIAVQPDGQILVGGAFNGANSIGGQARNHIARLDAVTGLADSFDPNASADVFAIAVQGDGKIWVGGDFINIGGQLRNHIARLDPANGLADSLDPNASGVVRSIVLQADGKILAGGAFTDIGGQPRNFIGRLVGATGLADSFNPDANNVVQAITLQPGGGVLAGGLFTSIGGQTRNFIGRVDGATGLADSFNPNANGDVRSIAVQADSKVLAGGAFTNIGGQPRNYFARLEAANGLADPFNPNASDVVQSIAVRTDGKILVGGQFESIGGQPYRFFARLSNDTAALQYLSVTQTAIVWTRGGSSPPFTRTTFEIASDNVNYLPLGNGTEEGSNWVLTGLSLPPGQLSYIRARGYYRSGLSNGSESVTELVRYGAPEAPVPTPTPAPTPTPTLTPPPTPTPTPSGTPSPSPTATATPRPTPYCTFDTFRQNFDAVTPPALPAGWVSTFTAGSANCDLAGTCALGTDWATTAADPDTPPNSAFHDAPGCVTDSSLDSPPIPISQFGLETAEFWQSYNFEEGYDGAVLEISINGGAFTDIVAAGGYIYPAYNAVISSKFQSPLAGRSAWTGNSGGYVHTSIGLPFAAFGQNIVFRFRLATDCSVAGAGWHVDSFAVQEHPPCGSPTPTPSPSVTPTPTPNGKIVFSSAPDIFESNYYIYTVDSNGQNVMQVFTPQSERADNVGPKWSPDGITIAFTKQPWPVPVPLHSYIATTGPAGYFVLTNRAADDFGPAWSPDGTRIAFTSNRDGNYEIYVMDANGSNQSRLTNNAESDSYPAWSLDGSKIAFTSHRDGNNEIYVMGANGSNQLRLTNNAESDSYPAWSPDGSKIAFTSHRDGNDEIYVMNADGSNPTNLTNDPGEDNQPAWSPNGAQIVFTTYRDGDGELFVMNANGSNQSRLTDNTLSDREPDWQRPSSFPTPTPSTPTPSPTLPPATPTPTGTPSPSPTLPPATPTPTGTPTPPVTPTATPPSPSPTPAAQALNLSTRMRVQTGDRVGIGGFIITGTAPKHVLLRAIGPSLTQSGVPDALADPVLELHGSGGFVTVINNNWRDDPAQEAAIIASGIPPTNDLESAIDAPLAPGTYTAVLRGNGDTSGVALVEVYDLSQPFDSKLANISTRAFVSTGDNIVIGGFFLGGSNGGDRVVVRGIGPSLTASGVPDALADPTLELRDGDGALLSSNNDWQDDPTQAAELIDAGLAPTNQLESGIAAILPPGPYTALLAGLNNGTGIGLVEVYDRGGP